MGLLVVGSLGVTVYEYIQAMAAFRSGQSPVAAVQATQQQIMHVMANPWLFTAYLVLLLALLFHVVRQISRKIGTTNDFWFMAAVLAAIVTLVRNFLKSN